MQTKTVTFLTVRLQKEDPGSHDDHLRGRGLRRQQVRLRLQHSQLLQGSQTKGKQIIQCFIINAGCLGTLSKKIVFNIKISLKLDIWRHYLKKDY